MKDARIKDVFESRIVRACNFSGIETLSQLKDLIEEHGVILSGHGKLAYWRLSYDAKFRGIGVGRKSWGKMLDELKERGFDWESHKPQPRAKKFYTEQPKTVSPKPKRTNRRSGHLRQQPMKRRRLATRDP